MDNNGISRTGLYWRTPAPLHPCRPTIVFLHAAWMSSTMWDETVASLSELSHNLLLVDLHGHGKSTGRAYTLDDQAKDVLSLLDELKLSDVLITGISMGATVALRMALAKEPTNFTVTIKGLVLISANASSISPSDKEAFTALRTMWISTPTPSEEIMNASILAWGGPPPDLEGVRARRIKKDWIMRHSGAENIDPTLQAMFDRESILERLGEIQVPVLLVHGEDDRSWPLSGARDIQKALVNAESVRLEVIPKEGHLLVHLREGGDVAEYIREFAGGFTGRFV